MSALWFAGVSLSDVRISFQGQSALVAGARAYVEEDGDVVHRDGPGSALWRGLRAALAGRSAPRELFLIVEGRDFQFVVPCAPQQAARARTFAAAICAAGARPADAPIRRGAGPGFPARPSPRRPAPGRPPDRRRAAPR